jgi:EpsI family protein
MLLMILMLIASALAVILHPTHKIADDGIPINLESMIPKQFADWQLEPQIGLQIVNPQQEKLIESIYTQTLARTYINRQGDRVMLSIAYGADQSDDKQLHYPEVCYPAQGFQVMSNRAGLVNTGFGSIKVKRLVTVLGIRVEPLTYWTTVGNQQVLGAKETKLAQLRYGFQGLVPDGLIFRVSSINQDTTQGFAMQNNFVLSLLSNLSAASRQRIAGLSIVNASSNPAQVGAKV